VSTPLEAIANLFGAPAREAPPFVVWTGKPPKPQWRYYAYAADAGLIWLAKIGSPEDPRLANEHATLQAVGSALAGTPLAGSLPSGVRYGDGCLIQEWVAGVPAIDLIVRYRRRPFSRQALAALCLRIVTWLAGFHRAAPAGDALPLNGIGRIHGDFTASNVMLDGEGRLRVVDWELSAPAEPQIFDLFHFLTNLALVCGGGDRRESFRHGFLDRTWLSEIVRRCVGAYGEVLATAAPGDGMSAPALRGAYERYLAFVLARRADLGLPNEGHFGHDLDEVLTRWPGTPHAFAG